MRLPIFPAQSWVPGDGRLLAVYGGSPPALLVVGGLVHLARVVETYPRDGVAPLTRTGRRGDPLVESGITVWLEGTLGVDHLGRPDTDDFGQVLARWQPLQTLFRSSPLELFLYYHPQPPETYRKLKQLELFSLETAWDDAGGIRYLAAFVGPDRSWYHTPPGL
jgi:hypothetical protein